FHFVGEHQFVEVPEQREIRAAQHLEVDGVGVGKQHQAVTGGETCEHPLGNERVCEDATPDIAEALVTDVEIEHARKLFHEIARLHESGFEALHKSRGGEAL